MITSSNLSQIISAINIFDGDKGFKIALERKGKREKI
jgi:hypothetical protein